MAKGVTIQADASQTGLGAALMQDGQPISYASRAMTDTEQNYAQTEKELLAIVFAYERFNNYIYGRNVVHVETDHKYFQERNTYGTETFAAHETATAEVSATQSKKESRNTDDVTTHTQCR